MKLIKLVLLLLIISPLSAAQSEPPPYLYYYSRMLGGIIIERADGTDSRIIGQDVIPAGFDGIKGPGWSPSGRYFAAAGYEWARTRTSPLYIFDSSGKSYFWGSLVQSFIHAEWSNDDKLLLVTGNYRTEENPSFWILDLEREQVLAQVGLHSQSYVDESISDFVWQNDQVVFYFHESDDKYFQLTVRFDGSVTKDPASADTFEQHYIPPQYFSYPDSSSASPTGQYEAAGVFPTTLKNLKSGAEVQLPDHSQSRGCRDFRWNDSEDYIITIDGTSDHEFCLDAVLGVTDHRGKLWRELGGCWWDAVCVGWLPSQVDIEIPPQGQLEPLQLDPVRYERAESIFKSNMKPNYRVTCTRTGHQITNIVTTEIEFVLSGAVICREELMSWDVQLAFEPKTQLLAIHGLEPYVSIWQKQDDGIWYRINQLNTYGYKLEFTPDGEYLRARNINAWKIYSVEDILRTAKEIE